MANCRTGQTGRTGGRKQGWGREGDSGASLRMWPRRPLRAPGAPNLTSAAARGRQESPTRHSENRGVAVQGLGIVSSLLVAPTGNDQGGEC